MLATLGMALIAIAWIFQLMHMRGKGKGIHNGFISLYAAGVALLLVGDLGHIFTTPFILNVIVLLAAVGVWQAANTKK